MKKLLILTLLSVLFMQACSAEATTTPILIYDMNDTYMADFESRLQTSSQGRLLITTIDGKNSQIIQNESINDLLVHRPPLLIINPVDRLSAFAIIEKAKLTDTALIFFNREPLQSDMQRYEHVYYVGADAQQSAEIQAEIIMELFGNNPLLLNHHDKNGDNTIQAVILKGQQGHQDAEARTHYVIETLIQQGYNVEVLETAIANFDMDQAETIMHQLIDTHGDDIEIVISNNDAMALGAIKALVAKGMIDDVDNDGIIDQHTEPWVPVVGIDGLDIAIEKMQSGHLYGTVLNDSQTMVEVIIELATYLAEGRSLDDFPYDITQGKYIWVDYRKLISNGESQLD